MWGLTFSSQCNPYSSSHSWFTLDTATFAYTNLVSSCQFIISFLIYIDTFTEFRIYRIVNCVRGRLPFSHSSTDGSAVLRRGTVGCTSRQLFILDGLMRNYRRWPIDWTVYDTA